jgi:very-long-chain enoyl-CoA reductase
MTQTLTALFFTIAGTVQMTIWAKQKHRAYKKDFGDKYPKQRKAIIPFFI